MEMLRTLDYGVIQIVDKSTITKCDTYIDSINVDGINDCDIYQLAEGYIVATLDEEE